MRKDRARWGAESIAGDRDNTEGHQSEPMLTPRIPNRPGCSPHRDQPLKGLLGWTKQPPKGPRRIYTCAYTWAMHFMSKLNNSFCSLRGFHFSQCSLFLSSHPLTTLSILLPGRNNRTQFRVARSKSQALPKDPPHTPSHPFPGIQAWQGQVGRNQACRAKVIVSTVHLPHPSVICNSNSLAQVLTHQ